MSFYDERDVEVLVSLELFALVLPGHRYLTYPVHLFCL